MADAPEWVDRTSYGRGNNERIPSTWTLQVGRDLKISVVRNHIYCPDSWVVNCSPWFEVYSLELPPTHENRFEAQSRGLALVREKINDIAATLRRIN